MGSIFLNKVSAQKAVLAFVIVFIVLNAVSPLNFNYSIMYKFDPWLWNKIQVLKSNRTIKDLSLIIWLRESYANGTEIPAPLWVNGTWVIDPQMIALKNYAVSLFMNKHHATRCYALSVLPVIMAKVPVTEAEKIAAYEFVSDIGDGEIKGHAALD